MREIQIFKMSPAWRKRFLNPKRLNAGWSWIQDGDDMEVVLDPEGKEFARLNIKTGEVSTRKTVMDIQW